ncbi:hypothetical protein H9Q10_10495 [Eikenella sp. S3360]|uniref:Septation protein A n=1 Tax=Eikenella glucosivorans TaxID=2766967 RepID=A0ABS0NCQ9_9NEIS|nr:hypothetical protein [Eikenella glucosivorans]MBH5330092.1 hypothetical protein [Eikenella glucosivorans]
MQNFGSTLAVLGVLAIFLDLFNYVPKALFWIYNWGDGVAWGIKIALIVVGGVLWLMGRNQAEHPDLAEDEDD